MNKYKNVKELIKAFIAGENDAFSGSSPVLSNTKIRGDKLFHYSTIIAERYEEKIIINVTKYSIQTDRLQKQLIEAVEPEKQILVHDVDLDYSGSLKKLALNKKIIF